MSRIFIMNCSCFFTKNNYFFHIYIVHGDNNMALDDSINKRMVKVVLGKMAGLNKVSELELENSIIDDLKAASKPKIRGIKEFFLLGVNELKNEIKKTKKKNVK